MLERLIDILGNRSLAAGGAIVFLALLLCGFGLPLPEDIILVAGGVLAWDASTFEQPSLRALWVDPRLHQMILVGLAGILAGDSVIYFIGRRLGTRVAEFRLLRRLIPPAKLQQVERLVRRRGNIMVVFARYLPGLRAPTYFTVGHSRLPYWEFLLFDGLAALVSAPLWVCLGYWFGGDIESAARTAAKFGHYILMAVGAVLLVLAARWYLRRRQQAAELRRRPPPAERAAER